MTLSQGMTQQIARIEESLGVLRRIAESRAGSSQEATLEYLEELRQKLVSEDFYLAVLGLFKRGKSTLINALLQSEVLPVGVVPVTSVITLLKYGEQPRATVSFVNGATKEVGITEIPQYITEKGNPRNAKGVKEVEVRVPSGILKSGITIIDTPGVGSTFAGGTQATYRFLERVDACLFTLAVDPPIGQSELDLLKAITPHARKLIFVLNKKDYMDEASLREAVSFCRDVIGSALGINDFPIYAVSAKWAHEGYHATGSHKLAESGVPGLMEVLNNLLHGEKQEILIASTATKALKTAEDLRISQEIAVKSAGMPLNRLEETLKQLDDFLRVVDIKKREIFYLLDGKSKEVVQMLDEDLESLKREREAGFLANLEAYANELLTSKRNVRETTGMLEEKLSEELRAVYSGFTAVEDERIAAKFGELVSTFSRHVDSLVGDVRRELSTLFGIKTEPPLPGMSLTSEHRFYYRSDQLPPIGGMFVGELSALLPTFLVKGTLQKRFMGQAKEAFDGTAGRIRYDYFVVRLDRGIIGLKREVGRLLDLSITAARDAVLDGTRMHDRSSEEVNVAVEELNRTLREIQSVKELLGGLIQGGPGPGGQMPSALRGMGQALDAGTT